MTDKSNLHVLIKVETINGQTMGSFECINQPTASQLWHLLELCMGGVITQFLNNMKNDDVSDAKKLYAVCKVGIAELLDRVEDEVIANFYKSRNATAH